MKVPVTTTAMGTPPGRSVGAAAFEAMSTTRTAATWRDYLALTKPRIISLLLITTLTAMVVAAGGWPGWGLFLAVAVGGYLAAGAANTINMLMDRDIDARMERTSNRPLVTHAIGVREAILFAVAQAGTAFVLLWAVANLLTAVLSMVGLVYYVGVYTAWLKRRSTQNIVIGGAAGAVPPLVGWAAVDGSLSLTAWILFALIFVWTPVHFWALALMIKDDYARVGVPMLPVVRGDDATIRQIALYTAVTALVSFAPVFSGYASPLYFGAAALANAGLIGRVVELARRRDRGSARGVFKFSLSYLALVFLALAIDRAMS
ncbi:MAG: protoheme IX farnesyltransferase [Chthonomonadales bacterium]|nr:protoheme IX farnesyltransferase [Chthonomonadales bacterium]